MKILDIDQYIVRNPHIGLLTSLCLVISNGIDLQLHNVISEFSLYVSIGVVLLVTVLHIIINTYLYYEMLTRDIDWNRMYEVISNSERMSYFQTEKCAVINLVGYMCSAIIAAPQGNMLVMLVLVLNMVSVFVYLSIYTHIQRQWHYSLFESFK